MGELVPFKRPERHWPEDVIEEIFSRIPLRDLPKVGALSKRWKTKFESLAAKQWKLYCPVLQTVPSKVEDPNSTLVAFNEVTKEWDRVPVHPSVFPSSRFISFVTIWGPVMVQVYSHEPETDASKSPLADERVRLVNKFTGQSVVLADERVRLVNIFTGQSVEFPGFQARLSSTWRKTCFWDEITFWNVRNEVKIPGFTHFMQIWDILFFSTSEGFRVILIYFVLGPNLDGRLLMYEFQSSTGLWKQKATTAHLDHCFSSQRTLVKDGNLYMIRNHPFGVWKYPLHQDEYETERLEEFEYESNLELPRVSYESTRSLETVMEESFRGKELHQAFVGLVCMDEKLMAVALGQVCENDSVLASSRMNACVYDVDEKTLEFTIVSCEDIHELPHDNFYTGNDDNYDYSYRTASDDHDKTIFLWPCIEEDNDVLTYNVAEKKWSSFPLSYPPHEKKEHQSPFQWKFVGGSPKCPTMGNFSIDSFKREFLTRANC